ncbi:MAG TPA: DUF6308 family protein [Streptosporangiaceae bacterium]
MSSLRGGDAVRRAAGRLRETLAQPGVRPAVAAYFDPAAGFAGMTFGTLGDNPPDQLTPADLLAVSLLDITWRPDVVQRLLGSDRARLAGLLAGISADVDLWLATDADLGAVDAAWDALLDIPGVGTASAAKLLARKRPRLCPITDKVVIRAVGLPGLTWEVLRCLLQDPAARAEVEALRPPEAAGASLLRILDVAIWVAHSNSHDAQRARLAGRDRAA